MSIAELVRIVLGSLFLFAGILVFILQIFGVFRLNYILNRLHAAAMGDTMGIFLCITGLCIFSGFNYTTAKLVLVVILFWVASPVSSHMTALLELYTNRRLNRHLAYEGELEVLEKKLQKENSEAKQEG